MRNILCQTALMDPIFILDLSRSQSDTVIMSNLASWLNYTCYLWRAHLSARSDWLSRFVDSVSGLAGIVD